MLENEHDTVSMQYMIYSQIRDSHQQVVVLLLVKENRIFVSE